jgi:MFS family permease
MTARPGHALLAMLAVQVLATISLTSASVLAPAVAPTLGLAPERIGWFAGLAYALAMLSGLRCGVWVARLGGVRVSQLALLAAAAGLLLATWVPPAGLLLAAMLIGVGYGLANPAAAEILAHHTPRGVPGLFFSIKQAGVPMGVALCGLLMPLGLAQLGWRWTAALTALTALLLALALQRSLAPLQTPAPHTPLVARSWLSPLRQVWAARELRLLSMVSCTYALMQQIFVTYVVALLHLQGGLSLAAAAGILSASQLVSMAARVSLGHVADRWLAPMQLLGLLGLGMGASMVLLAWTGAGGLLGAALLAAMACGATAMGWNGVFYAALIRSVPRESMAALTGATQFFTFLGGMLGPLVFGQLVHAGASHASVYTAMALAPVLVGVMVWRRASQQGRG